MMFFAPSHPQMDSHAWTGVADSKPRIRRNRTLGWQWIWTAHDVTRPTRLELDLHMISKWFISTELFSDDILSVDTALMHTCHLHTII